MYASHDAEMLQTKKIVGLTVTGVAVYQELLNALKFKIMIIEEAAEVLEAHLTAILHPNIKHLILIGDHKQLKPKVSTYELETKYQCNISMFERFILMKMDYVQLQHQRRMKTQFADFIRLIYGNTYQDHGNVYKINNHVSILGMASSLLFFDYRNLEQKDNNSSSTCNPFEAEMIANLVMYLINVGYTQSQISVISMYTKQVLEIIKYLRKLGIMEIKVSTVDNYQGEENDIIILSLVRSNNRNHIGFLMEENRINVALSRAKYGLFVFGNFLTIQTAALKTSNILIKIINLALEKKVLLDHIPLACIPHNRIRKVSTIIDWNTVPHGTCGLKCELPFPCGHKCQKICHFDGHPQKDCRSICGKQLKCHHICEQYCIRPCICTQETIKQLRCGHQQYMKCIEDPSTKVCTEICSKFLECGHQCEQPCIRRCRCLKESMKQLGCGHKKYMKCVDSPSRETCIEICSKQLYCGHPCLQPCNRPCICYNESLKYLRCGHQQQMKCVEDAKTKVCVEQCFNKLQCGHLCLQLCKDQLYVQNNLLNNLGAVIKSK